MVATGELGQLIILNNTDAAPIPRFDREDATNLVFGTNEDSDPPSSLSTYAKAMKKRMLQVFDSQGCLMRQNQVNGPAPERQNLYTLLLSNQEQVLDIRSVFWWRPLIRPSHIRHYVLLIIHLYGGHQVACIGKNLEELRICGSTTIRV